MKKGDGRVSYSVHPSPILGDGRMDALKDGRGWTGDGRTMDGAMDSARPKRSTNSSLDEGQRPSHCPRCGHQYDRGCEQ
jgi:hypothetical protein